MARHQRHPSDPDGVPVGKASARENAAQENAAPEKKAARVSTDPAPTQAMPGVDAGGPTAPPLPHPEQEEDPATGAARALPHGRAWWDFLREFAHMSRSTAVMVVVFLVVVLVYLWVRDEPLVSVSTPRGGGAATTTSQQTATGTSGTSATGSPTPTESSVPTSVTGTSPTATTAVPTTTHRQDQTVPTTAQQQQQQQQQQEGRQTQAPQNDTQQERSSPQAEERTGGQTGPAGAATATQGATRAG